MSKRILITGGAGFIGSHLTDKLIEHGHYVTIFDNLEPQIHQNRKKPPDYLSENIEFILNDVRDREALKKAIMDKDVVFHLAARVGVSQSMYEIDQYSDSIMTGTARLLDLIVNEPNDIKKIILTSSNTIYGEGKYHCETCGTYFYPKQRNVEQMELKDWETKCLECTSEMLAVPTDENSPYQSTSIYALAKETQEKQFITVGNTYGLNFTIFRLFLVYGSRQALSNPYTGVCSIFSNALLNGKQPILFEDGNQTRDFVHVSDVCKALMLGIDNSNSNNEIFNVGTGQKITIKRIAEILASKINPDIKPKITDNYRIGDIRHCFPDIGKISRRLGYKPSYSFKDGISEFIDWIKTQSEIKNNSDEMTKELRKKGLM